MNHLQQVKSGYIRHFLYATYFNMIALLIFITGTIHSIFPFLFMNTPYKLAKYIVTEAEKQFELGDKDD